MYMELISATIPALSIALITSTAAGSVSRDNLLYSRNAVSDYPTSSRNRS
jgi:hypothetical protein